ncbi:hypothetical protein MLD38_027757 [Melastoma candidum]|uniref:Uncharacterized protein n=1 Tax=Melastoma candidum TaxID=119954 RepID=A0ACB9P2L0_9MYRT|nr:hypothetical protein MLD38_027757 [Melastoma candidum]
MGTARNRTRYRNPMASSHRHEFLHPDPVFVAATAASSMILLLVVCFIIFISRRQQHSSRKSGSPDWNQGICVEYATQNCVCYNSSPEVRPGCLSGSGTMGWGSHQQLCNTSNLSRVVINLIALNKSCQNFIPN